MPNLLVSRVHSLGCAARGIFLALKAGVNIRICLAAIPVVCATAIALDFSRYEWLLCIVCMGIVLAAETMNTALERLADRVSEDYEEGIRDAKDLAAGAVLLASTMSAVVFAVIVVSKLV